jgi:hypothetical protein
MLVRHTSCNLNIGVTVLPWADSPHNTRIFSVVNNFGAHTGDEITRLGSGEHTMPQVQRRSVCRTYGASQPILQEVL